MTNIEQSLDHPFISYAEQGEHKVHIVVLPQYDWSSLPLSELEIPGNYQRVTVNHQYGWGNEKDPERIRFIEPNAPALEKGKDIGFEDPVVMIIKERSRAIRLYAESLHGEGEEEDFQNLLDIIPGFGEENLLKIQEWVSAVEESLRMAREANRTDLND